MTFRYGAHSMSAVRRPGSIGHTGDCSHCALANGNADPAAIIATHRPPIGTTMRASV
jgi:hypothetical protein